MPGGFGIRGIDGMTEAIRYARENKVPYFGICLGMQTMVIEFMRNVCGIAEAHSTEFAPAAKHRVFFKLRELKGVEDLGGLGRHDAPGRLALPARGGAASPGALTAQTKSASATVTATSSIGPNTSGR